jgi:two-component system nitrogen regulation response regulator GlnG
VFPAPVHRVEIAHTGTEALERVAEVRPDVILIDLRLPDKSGLDVLRQLRQIDARIAVVLVTVVRSADSAIEAMRQGAYDYPQNRWTCKKLDRVIGETLKVAQVMRERVALSRVVGPPPDDDLPGPGDLFAVPTPYPQVESSTVQVLEKPRVP